jgi:F-type H+-transporting ATPase subunit delta
VEVALERRNSDRVGKDLADFAELYARHSELRNVLENPVIPFASKRAIISQIGAKAGSAVEVLNLVVVLLQNNRIRLLLEVRTAFQDVLNDKLGILSGDVFTPAALSSKHKGEIEARVSALTGKSVKFGYHQDPSLIGGIKIHLRSTIYDASVSKQLEEIQKRIF